MADEVVSLELGIEKKSGTERQSGKDMMSDVASSQSET